MDGIIYSGWLEEDSKHNLRRAKERGGLNRKKAQKMMNLARTRGIRAEECTWSLDRTFLERVLAELLMCTRMHIIKEGNRYGNT